MDAILEAEQRLPDGTSGVAGSGPISRSPRYDGLGETRQAFSDPRQPRPSSDAARAARRVREAIDSELGNRLRRFSVRSVVDDRAIRLLIEGEASSYHLKQLASQAAIATLGPRPTIAVRNELVVCVS